MRVPAVWFCRMARKGRGGHALPPRPESAPFTSVSSGGPKTGAARVPSGWPSPPAAPSGVRELPGSPAASSQARRRGAAMANSASV